MRGGLKKPAQKAVSGIEHIRASADIHRQVRAKSVPKHKDIQRFGIPKPAPGPRAGAKAVSGELVTRRTPAASSKPAVADPLPSMVTSVSHQKLERMLDQALTHADTHKEALRYHAARQLWHRGRMNGRRRWLGLAAVLIILIAAFAVCWQKIPSLSVKAAGMRAHLSASVPSYSPDGYALAGPAKDVSGTVDIKYQASADASKNYDIIQSQSDMTSNMVGDNVVPKGSAVQTSQVNGNTVYIYGNTNDAAWVNNGVLYTIKDSAGLSSDELIKIVQGLNP